MKKLAALILSFIMLFCLTACEMSKEDYETLGEVISLIEESAKEESSFDSYNEVENVSETDSEKEIKEESGDFIEENTESEVLLDEREDDYKEIDESSAEKPALEESEEEEESTETVFTFRSDKLLKEHYEKHGIEMGFESKEDYEKAANKVINNPDC